MEALLAMVVMTSIDHEPWRWLLGLSALPLLIVIVILPVSVYNCVYIIMYVHMYVCVCLKLHKAKAFTHCYM